MKNYAASVRAKLKKEVKISGEPLNFKHEIERIQDISIGIDSGAKFIGFSAISEKSELISGTVELDTKTSDRLKERAMYRRNRRNRLWYREPRFDNRTKKEGWLPPSVERRYKAS